MKADRTLRVVLLGPPGAGKGTQAARVATHYGVPHIATGDIFRTNVKNDTPLGQLAQQYMKDGGLVPDDVVVEMIRERLAQPDVDGGFVLDGFPRTVMQAHALEELLLSMRHPVDVVLRFAIADEEVVRRISGRRTCGDCGAIYHAGRATDVSPACERCGGSVVQREDDREDVVRHRLEVYHRQTEPLEFFYWQRGLLRDVEATGAVDQVTSRALAILSEYESPPMGDSLTVTEQDADTAGAAT